MVLLDKLMPLIVFCSVAACLLVACVSALLNHRLTAVLSWTGGMLTLLGAGTFYTIQCLTEQAGQC